MSVLTPNMNLIESTVGVDTGLSWEQNLNASLDVIDSHDHTPGKGIPISPSSILINSDLAFAGYSITQLKTVRFTSQGSPISGTSPNLGCLYVSGQDLYFNDTVGDTIRITQAGSVVGTPGSITGLVAPASATYIPVNKTFVWQSDVNTPANMDMGSVVIRDILANSKGITISPPVALTADYAITYPAAAPTVNSVMLTAPGGTSIWQISYNAVVGSASQVTNGSATHTTLSAAIAASSPNWIIYVLQGAWTENVTITSTLRIVGSGSNSIITGNLTFTGATNCKVTDLKFTGNLTFDSTSSGNTVINTYVTTALVYSDSTPAGSGNYVELIQG